MKQAGIYVNDVYCGILTEDEEGFHFAYDEAFLSSKDAVAVSPWSEGRKDFHAGYVPTYQPAHRAQILWYLPTTGRNHQETFVSSYAGCATLLGSGAVFLDYW